jgi:hypothetical protein
VLGQVTIAMTFAVSNKAGFYPDPAAKQRLHAVHHMPVAQKKLGMIISVDSK